MNKNQISEFLTEDMAYLLGLIVGRGTINKSDEINNIVIDFPFKKSEIEFIGSAKGTVNVAMYLSNSIDGIVRRIKAMGFTLDKDNDESNQTVSLTIEFNKNALHWQFLIFLLNGDRTDYHSFRIPQAVFKADKEKQKEFVRGYFDVTGHARRSNARNEKGQRVYLEVDHRNWFLVLDICKILQMLAIPVDVVNFGHPNMRDPDAASSSISWAKEHQVKIFANQFLKIGSYLKHKEKMLSGLAKINSPNLGSRSPINIMDKRFQRKNKPLHPHENSEKLPDFLRGQHFDHYSDILNFLIQHDDIKPYD